MFGQSGDFVTSSEQGSYFALAFAAHIKALESQLGEFSIIEVGAGSGQFAIDLIHALTANKCMPCKYYIIEASKTLRARQQANIESNLLVSDISVEWLDSPDQPVECAVVIANEVLDALPVALISLDHGEIYERGVGIDDQQEFIFVKQNANQAMVKLVRQRLPNSLLDIKDICYLTEVNRKIDDFIGYIASFVNKGVFFYIDYGYPRHEYYHPQRDMGTLICHFQHTAHDDPFKWPGIQDITASVDFTAVAEAAVNNGLSVDCYSTQAHFLMASHVVNDIQLDQKNAQQIKKLLLPGEMGERFQVMIMTKNLELEGIELTMRDIRHRL
ncbi:MAG: SAM-dependent methyltransferase [Pseudomonadota bacterium]